MWQLFRLTLWLGVAIAEGHGEVPPLALFRFIASTMVGNEYYEAASDTEMKSLFPGFAAYGDFSGYFAEGRGPDERVLDSRGIPGAEHTEVKFQFPGFASYGGFSGGDAAFAEAASGTEMKSLFPGFAAYGDFSCYFADERESDERFVDSRGIPGAVYLGPFSAEGRVPDERLKDSLGIPGAEYTSSCRGSLGVEPTPLVAKKGMELMMRAGVGRDTSGSRASVFLGGFAGVCGASFVGDGNFAAWPTAAAGVCVSGVAGARSFVALPTATAGVCGASVVGAEEFAALPTATAGVCVSGAEYLGGCRGSLGAEPTPLFAKEGMELMVRAGLRASVCHGGCASGFALGSRSSLGDEPTPLLVKEGMELMVRTGVGRDTSGLVAGGISGGDAACLEAASGTDIKSLFPVRAACGGFSGGDAAFLEAASGTEVKYLFPGFASYGGFSGGDAAFAEAASGTEMKSLFPGFAAYGDLSGYFADGREPDERFVDSRGIPGADYPGPFSVEGRVPDERLKDSLGIPGAVFSSGCKGSLGVEPTPLVTKEGMELVRAGVGRDTSGSRASVFLGGYAGVCVSGAEYPGGCRGSLGAEPTPLFAKEGMELMVRTGVGRDTSGLAAGGISGGDAACLEAASGTDMKSLFPVRAACGGFSGGDAVFLEAASGTEVKYLFPGFASYAGFSGGDAAIVEAASGTEMKSLFPGFATYGDLSGYFAVGREPDERFVDSRGIPGADYSGPFSVEGRVPDEWLKDSLGLLRGV